MVAMRKADSRAAGPLTTSHLKTEDFYLGLYSIRCPQNQVNSNLVSRRKGKLAVKQNQDRLKQWQKPRIHMLEVPVSTQTGSHFDMNEDMINQSVSASYHPSGG